MNAQLRTVVVVALTTIAVAYTAPDLALPWHPWANYGMTETLTSRTVATVTTVEPGGPAANAGVRVGDRIDLAAMPLGDRRSLATAFNAERAGAHATFAFVRGAAVRRVTLVSTPHARSLADNVTDVAQLFALLAFPIIAMVLLLLRPSALTWAFFFYGLAVANGSVLLIGYLPTALAATMASWSVLFNIVGLAAFVIFALRFPSNTLTVAKRRVERGVLIAAVPLALANVYAVIGAYFLMPGVITIDTVTNWASLCGYVLGAGAFVAMLIHATPQERPRVIWVIFGFLVGYGGFAIYNALYTSGIAIPIWLTNSLQLLNILVPITVMYAILKHRVIDIRFFLNRALVYGLLTTIGVGLLVLLDWAVAKPLERFGVIVEVAGALILGFGIQRLHGFIDAVVDRYVFRSVHEAERHLDRVGRAMMYAESIDALDRLVVEESARALQLRSVAVFRRQSDVFARARAVGWTEHEAQALDIDDPLVLDLQAQRRGVAAGPFLVQRGDFPHGAGAPAFAVPVCIREQMSGFVLFGAHLNASDIDPNEQEVLERFVDRAGIAYDHVANAERAAENTRLRIELDFLRGLVQPQSHA